MIVSTMMIDSNEFNKKSCNNNNNFQLTRCISNTMNSPTNAPMNSAINAPATAPINAPTDALYEKRMCQANFPLPS